ncbi:hypothetical protein T261_5960 [Streptomyces lydicus]|nr:hypothetical protein T261_5960 [Streptomyces lydicus]
MKRDLQTAPLARCHRRRVHRMCTCLPIRKASAQVRRVSNLYFDI